MKLEVGKTYLTRDGRKARVICTDMDSIFPVAAVVRDTEGETLESYTACGNYQACRFESASDLVSEYREPRVRWFLENPSGELGIVSFDEEAHARSHAEDIPGSRVVKFIEVIK